MFQKFCDVINIECEHWSRAKSKLVYLEVFYLNKVCYGLKQKQKENDKVISVIENNCNALEVVAGESGVQSHPQLY